MTIFERTGRRTTKINTTLSVKNGALNAVFKFFPPKTPHWLNESQKTGFEEHQSPLGERAPTIRNS